VFRAFTRPDKFMAAPFRVGRVVVLVSFSGSIAPSSILEGWGRPGWRGAGGRSRRGRWGGGGWTEVVVEGWFAPTLDCGVVLAGLGNFTLPSPSSVELGVLFSFRLVVVGVVIGSREIGGDRT